MTFFNILFLYKTPIYSANCMLKASHDSSRYANVYDTNYLNYIGQTGNDG